MPRAGNPNPVLASRVVHSFQEICVILCEAQVVVGAHVDDIVQRPPSQPAGTSQLGTTKPLSMPLQTHTRLQPAIDAIASRKGPV